MTNRNQRHRSYAVQKKDSNPRKLSQTRFSEVRDDGNILEGWAE